MLGWSSWSEYGPCSATCGTDATKQKTRDCLSADGNVGVIGQDCAAAPTFEDSSCGLIGCPGTNTVIVDHRVEKEALCDSTEWTEWSAYGPCSTTCGSTAKKRRNRQCRDPNGSPGKIGHDCLGLTFEDASCSVPLCPRKANFNFNSEFY